MLRKVHWEKPVLESLFKKVAGPQVWNFIKNRLQRRCFPIKFAKFFRAPFFTEHLQWLLFKIKAIQQSVQRFFTNMPYA